MTIDKTLLRNIQLRCNTELSNSKIHFGQKKSEFFVYR